ncbi:MAG: hypothetical protein H6672_18185 [Anaerolineaceae bacterium]|nr:hypothetical protein [Anaerolineaceae bacterium]
MLLLTVVGQAFSAAGYELEERPVQWAGGQFRFVKSLESGLRVVIEFQLLAYLDTEFAAGNPSRFRVTLSRSDGLRRTLSALVVEDFGVAILPSADHWWTFTYTEDLGKALAEAGHLIVGYGLPWLAGELTPPLG